MQTKIRLICKIISIKGHCRAGHKVGEEFEATFYKDGDWQSVDRIGMRTPSICGHLYYVLYPYLIALQYGGEFPWSENKDLFYICCPDPINSVCVEVRRIKT